MRAVALHPDVLVATSAIWQTNCTIVRGRAADGGAPSPTVAGAGRTGDEGTGEEGTGEETFVIDSLVLPDELSALPTLLEQASFSPPSGLLATHGDWDHLLGRLAFPEAAVGCAQDTAERLRAEPGAVQRELRAFDETHFLERDRPLALGAIQALPVPGSCELGDASLELHPAAGHSGEGMAVMIGWAGVLVAGDYLSPVELPVLGTDGTIEAYTATLSQLRGLVERVEHVVPGHGPVLGRERALTLLEDDLADAAAGRPSGTTRLRPRLRRSSRSAPPPRSAPPR